MKIPLPKDPRHQRFADLVLAGTAAQEAYRKAGFKAAAGGSIRAAASRMLTTVSVSRYMEAIKRRAAEKSEATVEKKRELLYRAMFVPLTSIDLDDPERKNHDLLRKVKRRANEFGEDVEFEKLDPLAAMKIDNTLSGDDPEANAMVQMAEALSALGKAGGTLPVDKM